MSWSLELVFWVLFVNWDLDLGTYPELDSGLELPFFAYGCDSLIIFLPLMRESASGGGEDSEPGLNLFQGRGVCLEICFLGIVCKLGFGSWSFPFSPTAKKGE